MNSFEVHKTFLDKQNKNAYFIFGIIFCLAQLPFTTFDKIIKSLYDFYTIKHYLPQYESHDIPNVDTKYEDGNYISFFYF